LKTLSGDSRPLRVHLKNPQLFPLEGIPRKTKLEPWSLVQFRRLTIREFPVFSFSRVPTFSRASQSGILQLCLVGFLFLALFLSTPDPDSPTRAVGQTSRRCFRADPSVPPGPDPFLVDHSKASEASGCRTTRETKKTAQKPSVFTFETTSV